jgi:hypothetical protein
VPLIDTLYSISIPITGSELVSEWFDELNSFDRTGKPRVSNISESALFYGTRQTKHNKEQGKNYTF